MASARAKELRFTKQFFQRRPLKTYPQEDDFRHCLPRWPVLNSIVGLLIYQFQDGIHYTINMIRALSSFDIITNESCICERYKDIINTCNMLPSGKFSTSYHVSLWMCTCCPLQGPLAVYHSRRAAVKIRRILFLYRPRWPDL